MTEDWQREPKDKEEPKELKVRTIAFCKPSALVSLTS